MLTSADIKRFEKFIRRGPDACWHWIGSTPSYKFGDIQGRAVRLAYEYYHSPIRPDYVLLYLCGSSDCVNPLHQIQAKRGIQVGDERNSDDDWGRWRWQETHCRNGHVFSLENTNWVDNERVCRQCGCKGLA